jgi:hypothetical protein
MECAMSMRDRTKRAILLINSALALILVSPARLNLFMWDHEGLIQTNYPADALVSAELSSADLNGDGRLENLDFIASTAIIQRNGEILWSSPPDWRVIQASISDFNNDDQPEVALLLWREFAPWPVDAYMLHAGRIDDFHDRHNQSCHLILIGWRGQAFGEIWAGSALADPIVAFRAADLEGDGRHELIALEGDYTSSKLVAQSLTIWDWNGFGFTLRWRGLEGNLQAVSVSQSDKGPLFLIVQGTARR